MSLNTRKQRNYLYNRTFLKWSIEERLIEFQKTALEVSLAIHNFGHKADNETFQRLNESLADFETMLETAEETFPNLRSSVEEIKKAKLIVLSKHTEINKEADKVQDKADKIREKAKNLKAVVKSQQEKKPKNFFQRLFNS